MFFEWFVSPHLPRVSSYPLYVDIVVKVCVIRGVGYSRIRLFYNLFWALVWWAAVSIYSERRHGVMIDLILVTWIDGDLCVWVDGKFSENCLLSFLSKLPLYDNWATSKIIITLIWLSGLSSLCLTVEQLSGDSHLGEN